MSVDAYGSFDHNFHRSEFSKEVTHNSSQRRLEDADRLRISSSSSSSRGSSAPARGNRGRPTQTKRSSPGVTQYTDNVLQMVEAKILSRLETEAGRQILLAEAVYYNNDLDAARAAIVRCAKKKVKRKMRRGVDNTRKQSGRNRGNSGTSTGSTGSGRQRSRSGGPNTCTNDTNNDDTNDTLETQTTNDTYDTYDTYGTYGTYGTTSSSSYSLGGVEVVATLATSTPATEAKPLDQARNSSQSRTRSGVNSEAVLEQDPTVLNQEIAAEAEALGLRAEDIPFNAADLTKISGRRLSREPMQMAASAAAAIAAAAATGRASALMDDDVTRVGSGRGPVFSKSLEGALACNVAPLRENAWVPDVVMMSLNYLNTHALETEGLWRIPGNIGKVKEYKLAWDAGVGVAYASEETRPHDICSLLLMYFRELPGTIFGASMARQFVNDQDVTDEDEIVDRLSGLVGMLPQANRDTLHAMIHHFTLLAKNSGENMMTSENIATCVWASQGYYQSMKHMIDNYDLIFYMYG